MTPLLKRIDSTARTVMSQKMMRFAFDQRAQGSRKWLNTAWKIYEPESLYGKLA